MAKHGDFVFAHLRGHPKWPSVVRELKENKVLVDFICPEKSWAWVSMKKIELFSDHIMNEILNNKRNKHNSKLREAIDEMIRAMKNRYEQKAEKKSTKSVDSESSTVVEGNCSSNGSVSKNFQIDADGSISPNYKPSTLSKSIDNLKISPIATRERTECLKKTEDEKIRHEYVDYELNIDHQFDLKEIKVDDILKSFPKHKAVLQDLFRANERIPDSRYKPERQYLLILDELLSRTQQQNMYLKIQSEFDPATVDNVTSNHENLFWTGMLPEWALLIFMEKFSFNRTDAITQLVDQDRSRVSRLNPFDLSF